MKTQLKKFNPEKIKELRKKQKLNQAELSAMTKEIDPTGKGIGEAGIQRIESRHHVPTADNLYLIATALDTCNINQFFDEPEVVESLKRSKAMIRTQKKLKKHVDDSRATE